jgi:hypothetical protein
MRFGLINGSFLSFACPKERNKEKGSQKSRMRRDSAVFGKANAHEQSSDL